MARSKVTKQSSVARPDCFVTLAMTGREVGSLAGRGGLGNFVEFGELRNG
jgi:hypothetical protein